LTSSISGEKVEIEAVKYSSLLLVKISVAVVADTSLKVAIVVGVQKHERVPGAGFYADIFAEMY